LGGRKKKGRRREVRIAYSSLDIREKRKKNRFLHASWTASCTRSGKPGEEKGKEGQRFCSKESVGPVALSQPRALTGDERKEKKKRKKGENDRFYLIWGRGGKASSLAPNS